MSTVTFDTLKFVKTLEAGGINAEQAEAIAAAYRDASNDQEIVTKKRPEAGIENRTRANQNGTANSQIYVGYRPGWHPCADIEGIFLSGFCQYKSLMEA